MRWCAVPDQHNAFTFRGVLPSELIEKQLHTRAIQTRQDEPEHAPCLWMHTGIEPEPFVARINCRNGSLSNGRPDTPQDWLEAEASFVFAPSLDLLIRVFCFERFDSQF